MPFLLTGNTNQSLVGTNRLRESSLLIVGGGGIGSIDSELLCRAGVTRQTLWDLDTMEVRNISRSAYDVSALGKPKTLALSERIRRINPLAEVTCLNGDILKAPDQMIVNLARQHDVVLVAADNFAVHERLNGLLYSELPVIYTYVVDDGNSAEVIRTAPGEPGCVRCLTNFDERQRGNVAGDFQALGLDFSRVALEAARVVLGILLQGASGGELFQDYIQRFVVRRYLRS